MASVDSVEIVVAELEHARSTGAEEKISPRRKSELHFSYDDRHLSTDTKDSQWKTCMGRLHIRFIQYVCQIVFSLIVLLFCMVKILRDDNDKQVYVTMLFSILSYHMPAPSLYSK